MTNDFLPEGYKAPANKSNYLKLEEGLTRFRILSKSITGWQDWKEENDEKGNIIKKPLRTRTEPSTLVNPKKPAKHFWAFIVWDYKSSNVKIMEITQRTIQDAIIELYKDEDWGSPINYDLKITRTGKDMETKYNVVPGKLEQVSQEILITYASKNINLEALFDGLDPFAEDEKAEEKPAGRELKQFPVKNEEINPFND